MTKMKEIKSEKEAKSTLKKWLRKRGLETQRVKKFFFIFLIITKKRISLTVINISNSTIKNS
uniref:Candidate secreted effector n=1 Tax=Meloidogyne incognita TaxID=6306 RepID=A0A914L702_MELIC